MDTTSTSTLTASPQHAPGGSRQSRPPQSQWSSRRVIKRPLFEVSDFPISRVTRNGFATLDTSGRQRRIARYGKGLECHGLRRELTTVLTTTMTTMELRDTSRYTTAGLLSCLVIRSACSYGSEGWGFESLRAHFSVCVPPATASPLPATATPRPGPPDWPARIRTMSSRCRRRPRRPPPRTSTPG